MNDSPPSLDHVKGTLERVSLVFDEVRDNERYGAGYSGQTVNDDVGSLEAIIDEIGGLMEKLADVASLVVVDGDVEEVGDFGPGVAEIDSFGG